MVVTLTVCKLTHFLAGPGQLQIRLDVSPLTHLKIYRPPQEDMTMAVAEDEVPPDVPGILNKLLATLALSDTVRIFGFHSLQGTSNGCTFPIRASQLSRLQTNCVPDLHTFQAALTGFSVLFDGFVTSVTTGYLFSTADTSRNTASSPPLLSPVAEWSSRSTRDGKRLQPGYRLCNKPRRFS